MDNANRGGSYDHPAQIDVDEEEYEIEVKNGTPVHLTHYTRRDFDQRTDQHFSHSDTSSVPQENVNVEKKLGSFLKPSPQFQIYISHFLSSWGDRMWMFAGGLFLIEVTPGSLRLVALYGASQSVIVIILGSYVGRWVDRKPRMEAARTALLTQNLMVCLCALLLCLNIVFQETWTRSGVYFMEYIIQFLVIVTACLARIGSLAQKLAIEKDWIVVISEKNETKLSNMNSVLRTVDLSTELLAPVLVGFIMTFQGMIIGGIVIAGWNVVSLGIEYFLLLRLFNSIPALRNKTTLSTNTTPSPSEVPKSNMTERLSDAARTWKCYLTHPVRNAGLSLAFLYMTVVSLDNYSRAYVYESGVSKGVLGIMTACASLSGILGALVFPKLRKKYGILKTGVAGFSYQSSCLLLCAISVFLPGTLFGPFSQSTGSGVNTAAVNISRNQSFFPQNYVTPNTSEFSDTRNFTVYDIKIEDAHEIVEYAYDSKPSNAKNSTVSDKTNSKLRTFTTTLSSVANVPNVSVSNDQFTNLQNTTYQTNDILSKTISTSQITDSLSGFTDMLNLTTSGDEITDPPIFVHNQTVSSINLTSSRNITDSITISSNITESLEPQATDSQSYASVVLLLLGIILSRSGLWVADLSVSQILQMDVAVELRGGINGVQSSLNQSFSLLSAILLILLPGMESFGAFILISVGFVMSGLVLFGFYARANYDKSLDLSYTVKNSG